MALHRIYIGVIVLAGTGSLFGVFGQDRKNSSEKARVTKHIEVKSTRENFVKPMEEVRKDEKSAGSTFKKDEHKDKDQSIVHEKSNRSDDAQKPVVRNDQKNGSVKKDGGLKKRQGQARKNSTGKR